MTDSPHTLLVTGGAGFIGSNFVAQAVEKGHKVVVLDALTYAGHRANLEWIANGNTGGTWQLAHGTITDRALVLGLLREYRIRHIINFAAESHVDNSIAGPASFIDTNINGTFQLLEACREYRQGLPEAQQSSFRFVQISTDEVYGSLGDTGTFTETSPLQPNSPYSASKAAGDHLAHAWFNTYGFPAIVTRSSNNYGPRQHPEKLIPHMIACALAGKKLPVYGDGKHIRDWIHVDDHCHGIWLALEQGVPGEAYNFGGNSEVENFQLVQNLCSLLDAKHPKQSGTYHDQIAFVTDRLGHDRRYAMDDSKAQQALGFTRRYRLEQGLETTVDWYLDNQPWCQTIKHSHTGT